MFFSAEVFKIGINPYVFLPANILHQIFQDAGKDKGPIPVCIKIRQTVFKQTLVKYSGHWRLYLNTPMRKTAGKETGDTIELGIAYDAEERSVPIHPKLKKALRENANAQAAYRLLPPSRKKEILRYINFLKTEEAIDRNIKRTIQFLLGKERFIGREKP